MKNVILAGNAITASIIYGYLSSDDRYQIMGLTVDEEYLDQGGISGLNSIALNRISNVFEPENCAVIMAMGYNDINRSRESMYLRLKEMGYQIETYIHPDAGVYTQLPIGEGCIILPCAVVEPYVSIGNNNFIGANVTVAHHSTVSEHCWIASGAVISGKAKIERNTFLGVNSTIVNEVIVGEYNIIGAGALITKNTKASSVHLARSGEELRYSSSDYATYFGV